MLSITLGVLPSPSNCQFGALTPLEPRLGKKLIDPLTSLIHGTTAMSLLYECISTVVSGMPNHTPSIQVSEQYSTCICGGIEWICSSNGGH